ncbi:MAG: hypothetical protein AVDCRST_MAG10-652, partial [uncultured Acidimicrobiales bacterium]
ERSGDAFRRQPGGGMVQPRHGHEELLPVQPRRLQRAEYRPAPELVRRQLLQLGREHLCRFPRCPGGLRCVASLEHAQHEHAARWRHVGRHRPGLRRRFHVRLVLDTRPDRLGRRIDQHDPTGDHHDADADADGAAAEHRPGPRHTRVVRPVVPAVLRHHDDDHAAADHHAAGAAGDHHHDHPAFCHHHDDCPGDGPRSRHCRVVLAVVLAVLRQV